jgi:uncharacterized protein YjbJ (UPF0337 family)
MPRFDNISVFGKTVADTDGNPHQTKFGKGHPMKSGTRDEAEGKWHQVKGKFKEIAGKFSKDSKLEAEGRNEKIAGKVQDKIGQVKKVVDK